MSQEPSLLIWNRVPWILFGLGHMDSFFDPTISYLVRRDRVICFVLFGYYFYHFYLKLTDTFSMIRLLIISKRLHVIGSKFNRKELGFNINILCSKVFF